MRGLALESEERELASTVRRFCEDQFRSDGEHVRREFDRGAWRRLAELGVFMLATEDGFGGATHVVAVMSELGAAGFAGPLAQTALAVQVLPPEDRERVAGGSAIATVAAEHRLVPWAPLADVFVKLERDGFAYRAVPAAEIVPIRAIDGQGWGEVELDTSDRLGTSARAVALANVALAAYLAGAAQRMTAIAADYVKHRRQFGRSLGEFQAVAHPLADSEARAWAAMKAALYAAYAFDSSQPDATALAAAARLSATEAGTRAAYAGHQALGGMGFVEGTLLAVLSLTVRAASLMPPGLEVTRETVIAPDLQQSRA